MSKPDHFECVYGDFTCIDWRDLLWHREFQHGENMEPWVVSVRPERGSIVAYRPQKETP